MNIQLLTYISTRYGKKNETKKDLDTRPLQFCTKYKSTI